MPRLVPDVPRWDEPGLELGARLARAPAWAALVAYVVGLSLLLEVSLLALDRIGVATLWFPAGFALFALLASPLARWPALVVAGLVVGAAAGLVHGRPLGTTLAIDVVAAVQAVAGAWLTRLAVPRVTARTLRGVTALVAGPGIATVVTGAVWRMVVLLQGEPPDLRTDVFWAGSILGAATFGWLLVAWAERTPARERPVPALAETILAVGSLGGSLALLQLDNSVFATEILLFPPVLWLAVRFGPRGGSAGVVAGALGILFTVWSGNVVIGLVYLDPVRTAFAVQLFLAMLCTPTAFVTAVVAERETAEERRRLLARAMDQSVDGLGVYEEDGTILWVNAAAARFYGVPAAELIGRRAWQVVPRGSLERWRHRWSQLAADGLMVRQDTTRGADGRVTPWEVSVALVRASGRQLAVAAMRDVSDRQRASEALRLAGIGTLAAGVAHEINNPLATVVGNLGLLRERLAGVRERGDEPALARFAEEWLDPIVDAEHGARRVRDVVAELRVFARAEALRGPIDVGRAMRSALSLAQSEIQQRARLVTRIADVPPVAGSEGRLAQAFANVLVNAARAIPEGASQENEIRVEVRAREGEVVAEVSDTGVGMSQAVRSRIFEPFFTTRDIGEGSGLGLAVTHAIVTAMRGRIDVDSAPGAGTRFRVVLPALKGALAAAPAPGPAAAEARASSPPPPAPVAPPRPPTLPAPVPAPPAAAEPPAGVTAAPHPRLKLLVVDDEPLVARSLQRILSREHDVDVADRARAALDRIAGGERFDAVLCDLMMPDVNGMAFHDEVAILDPDLQARIVFVTGGAFTDSAREFLDRIPNLRLEKPVDPSTLRETVRRFTPRPPR